MIKRVVNKGKVINYSILLLMVIFMTGWLYLAPRIGDDVQDMEAVKGGGIPSILTNILTMDIGMWHHWSSRIFINYLMFVNEPENMKWIFTFVTGLMTVGLIIGLVALFRNQHYLPLFSLLVLLFSWESMSTAGWIATIITYWWTLCTGIFALYLINIECYSWKKVIILLLSTILFLFAFNNEQLLVFGTVIYVGYLIYQLMHHLSWISFLPVPFALIVNWLILLTCPGNKLRYDSSIHNFFKDFNKMTVINKVDLGVFVTGHWYLFTMVPAMILLSILFIMINRNDGVRILSWIPLLGILIGNSLTYISSNTQRLKRLVTIDQHGWIWNISQNTIGQGFQYFLIIIVFGVITYLIWESFGKQAWFAELIWIAGWLSRITMGFSPTIYASSDRTFIFLTITMLFLSGWLIIKYRQVLIKRSLSIAFLILLAITWVPVIVRMLIPDKYI
ncbi:hypothetical protein [Limosilactobacillus portuensis]|uniref:hypothetical protein n=1 Tax=Limosilactobacillus portuensis TaxID=2742601 RepID=UPI003D74DB14